MAIIKKKVGFLA